MTWRDLLNGLWLLLMLVVVPGQYVVLAILRHRSTATPAHASVSERVLAIPRRDLYPRTIWGLGQFFLITLLLDWMNGWPESRKSVVFPQGALAWVVAAIAVHQVIWFGGMVLRRVRKRPLNAATEHLLPRSGGERIAFIGVAVTAGITEEFLFRGFGIDRLVHWGVPVVAAVAFVNLSFGAYHGYKSAAGMIRSSVLGLALAISVLKTGALLPAIVAHTVMDVLAGWFTLPLARRWGIARPADLRLATSPT